MKIRDCFKLSALGNRSGFPKLGISLYVILGFCCLSAAGQGLNHTLPAKDQERLRQLGSRFVENKGQWNSRARFLATNDRLSTWLADDGIVYDYHRGSVSNGHVGTTGQVVRMRFDRGSQRWSYRPGKVSSLDTDFIRDTGTLRARSFDNVMAKSVYPGVDLRAYFDKGVFRYDLDVKPGADPRQIVWAFDGSNSIDVKAKDIRIGTKLGDILQADLSAYQIIDGKRHSVPANFKALGGNRVCLDLGRYDHSRTLVIDPLVYGTFYGGNNGLNAVTSVVSDPSGGVYFTGWTQASDFPVLFGPYGFNIQNRDAFVTKLQGDAYNHDYSAIFGGSFDDAGQTIRLDPMGNVWILGTTTSADFPGLPRPGRGGILAAFVIEFRKTANGLLNPLPTSDLLIDGKADVTVGGFAITPSRNPHPNDPVEMVIVGDSTSTLTALDQNSHMSSYMLRYTYDPVSAQFALNQNASFYVGDSIDVTLHGLDLDADGNAYIAGGIVLFHGNSDTSGANPVFVTTPGVFQGGRLIQNEDCFVRKYDRSGNMVYSAILGGSDNDHIGGHDAVQTLDDLSTGSALCVDSQGNVYVTGTTFSFNFPRTRGVYGQNFDANQNVFVTKISPDASQIVWSTNLKTRGKVFPSGVAIDPRGTVFVTGIAHPYDARFPEDDGLPPGDPNLPTKIDDLFGVGPLGTLVQTQDDNLNSGFQATWVSPVPPEIPTTEGFINVLDPTGSTLIYGSYIGGKLDECVYGPYVDQFGDVWISGWSDSFRNYDAPGKTQTRNFKTIGLLPAQWISPNAFKTSPANGNSQTITNVAYGALSPDWPQVQPFKPTINMDYERQGIVIKLRVGLASVKSVTLGPTTIAGGLGASSTGTVLLSGPAPAGGADITLNIDKGAVASFDPTATVTQAVITIPSGQTSGAFFVFSRPVTAATQVQVKGTFLGTFQIGLLTVVPWLQQLTLTPNAIVGGNSAVGRVVLAQNAPAGGVSVDLSTDSPNLISFPGGSSVTVSEGQSSATFTISTQGVPTQTNTTVTASLLGVGETQGLQLNTANLASLGFAPIRVAGGTTSTGTVFLDGQAGSTFTVNLSLPAGTPAGYIIRVNGVPSTVLTFNQGDSSATFTLDTAYEPVSTQRVVTASRPAQGSYPQESVAGTLFVDAVDLLSLSLNPSTVGSGQQSTGTVALKTAAGEGGVVVLLSSDNANAQVPPSVTVAAGSTQATFTITTGTVLSDTVANIKASRGGGRIFSRPLTILHAAVAISVTPNSVLGGLPATGKVTLSAPAPLGGAIVSLGSSNPAVAQVPQSAAIAQGQTTATFPVTTSPVSQTVSVTLSAQIGGGAQATTILQVRAVHVVGLAFSPSVTKGGRSTAMSVMLDGPAPVGGATVLIQASLPQAANLPTAVTVPAGKTSMTVTVLTNHVSRTVADSVRATYNGSMAGATLTIIR